MSEIHGRLMNDPAPTDILTLDYGDGIAELFISLDMARRQARDHGNTFDRELELYLAHGLLHLSGYNDHTRAQTRRMRSAETKLLNDKKV